jgi:hypothetical protein
VSVAADVAGAAVVAGAASLEEAGAAGAVVELLLSLEPPQAVTPAASVRIATRVVKRDFRRCMPGIRTTGALGFIAG